MMKVYLLDLGKIGIDKNLMLSRAVVADRYNKKKSLEWIELPVWAVLIVTENHKILYDLGCLSDAMDNGWSQMLQDQMPVIRNENQFIEKQLSLIDLTPKDIDTVIVSHFHADHFGGIELFSHCDIYVPREDWANALMASHMTAGPYAGGTYIRRCLDFPIKRYIPISIDDDFELVSGLEIITLPGHVANLLGLIVHLPKEGNLIFTSDSMAMAETYDYNALPARAYDSFAWDKSIKKIRRLERQLNAKVFISHSMEWFKKYRKAPDFYE